MLVFMSKMKKPLMKTACAARPEFTGSACQGNLFLQAPDTDLSDFLRETAAFAAKHPEIIAKIGEELDAAAREKSDSASRTRGSPSNAAASSRALPLPRKRPPPRI